MQDWALAAMYLASKTYQLLKQPNIIGAEKIPKEGPAIIMANHRSSADIPLGFLAIAEGAKRFPRVVVRHTLVDPLTQELEEVKQRTGKKDFLNSANSLILFPRFALARLFLALNVISVRRGSADRSCIRACDQTLIDNRLLVIFPQDSRNKEGLLRNLKDGPALIARRHPEVPLIFMSIFRPPDGKNGINISRTYTYAEILQEFPEDYSLSMVTTVFGDKIAEPLSERVRNDWQVYKNPPETKAA